MNAASFPEKNATEFHKKTDRKKETDHKDATRMTERLDKKTLASFIKRICGTYGAKKCAKI